MSWNERLQEEPSEQDNADLYYEQTELLSSYIAVVRIALRDERGINLLAETSIERTSDDPMAEFATIASTALRMGAEVTVICADGPETLGLIDP